MILRVLLILQIFLKFLECSPYDGQRDLKAVMMYFSEPFLNGATLDGKPLIGEESIFIAEKICDNIETLRNENSNNPELAELFKFADYLRFGYTSTHLFLFDTKKTPQEKQQMFLDKLKEQKVAIILSGWTGHAIALIVKNGKSMDTFDLTVINTGLGLDYHYHSVDPNNIYPKLSRVWMEFKNIPQDEIFSSNAWFIEAMIMMKAKSFLNDLAKISLSTKSTELHGPAYFYGTFLNNFREYLIEPELEKRDDRLRPMQMSGTCTVSSLVGALFYMAPSEKDFQFYRVALGHALIQNLLNVAETDTKLKIILTDGFHSEGRMYFKRLTSSMAKHSLELLEEAFPDEFRHAGLIGDKRSEWLFTKKDEAINALMNNQSIFGLILRTVELCKGIFKYLESNPIREESTKLLITEEERKLLDLSIIPLRVYSNDLNGLESYELQFNSYLPTKKLVKPVEAISNFDEFYSALNTSFNNDFDRKYFTRVLEVFRTSPKEWWNLIDNSVGIEKLKGLQEIGRQLARKFAKCKKDHRSFDDIVLLSQIQILAWKSAVEYN